MLLLASLSYGLLDLVPRSSVHDRLSFVTQTHPTTIPLCHTLVSEAIGANRHWSIFPLWHWMQLTVVARDKIVRLPSEFSVGVYPNSCQDSIAYLNGNAIQHYMTVWTSSTIRFVPPAIEK